MKTQRCLKFILKRILIDVWVNYEDSNQPKYNTDLDYIYVSIIKKEENLIFYSLSSISHFVSIFG